MEEHAERLGMCVFVPITKRQSDSSDGVAVVMGVLALLLDKDIPADVCFTGECLMDGSMCTFGNSREYRAILEGTKAANMRGHYIEEQVMDAFDDIINEEPHQYDQVEMIGVRNIFILAEVFLRLL